MLRKQKSINYVSQNKINLPNSISIIKTARFDHELYEQTRYLDVCVINKI